MKKLISLLIVMLLFININAQSPNSFKYQSVVRDANGDVVASQVVDFRISILQASVSGTNVYSETHSVTTNQFGLANFNIGEGVVVSGLFSNINWGSDAHFVKTELDADGNGFIVMGTSQLMSVPYALHAKTADVSKTYFILTGAVTDVQATAKIASEVGENTQIVYITGTTNLTTVDLSSISELVKIKIENNTVLSSVNLSNLQTVYDGVTIMGNPLLSSIDFTNLSLVSGNDGSYSLNITNNGLSSLTLDNLTEAYSIGINGNNNLVSVSLNSLTKTYLEIVNNATLNSLSTPSVVRLKALIIDQNPLITNIDFPSLAEISEGYLSISTNNLLNSINLSSLTTSSGSSLFISVRSNPVLTSFSLPINAITSNIYINSNSTLASINIPNLSLAPAGTLDLNGNALLVSAINGFLSQLVAILPTLTSSQINLSNQTPLAPPSGQGITDVNTLTTNGNFVTTD